MLLSTSESREFRRTEDYNLSYIYVFTVTLCDILKANNGCLKYSYCVTACTICVLADVA
jgi:hypothetical protein